MCDFVTRFFSTAAVTLFAATAAAGQSTPAKPDATAIGAPGVDHDITLQVPLAPEVDPNVVDEEAYIAAAGWPEKTTRIDSPGSEQRDVAVKGNGAVPQAAPAPEPAVEVAIATPDEPAAEPAPEADAPGQPAMLAEPEAVEDMPEPAADAAVPSAPPEDDQPAVPEAPSPEAEGPVEAEAAAEVAVAMPTPEAMPEPEPAPVTEEPVAPEEAEAAEPSAFATVPGPLPLENGPRRIAGLQPATAAPGQAPRSGPRIRIVPDTGEDPDGLAATAIKPISEAAKVENNIEPVDVAALPASVRAAYDHGLALADGTGVPVDLTAAAWEFRRAAQAGHPGAQFELGWAFETGQGVEQSYNLAIYWYEHAARGGDSRALNNLGWLYAQGRGLGRNLPRAIELYTAAAEAGEASAMGNLAWLMENGIGMDQDFAGAAALYTKAADLGDSQSMLNLGNLYLAGDGVPKDTAAALALFDRAEAAGREEALSYIGEVYETSPDLRDPDRAAAFYLRALEAGDPWPASRGAESWDGQTVAAMQALLAARDLYDGPIDGAMGPGSQSAIEALLTSATE